MKGLLWLLAVFAAAVAVSLFVHEGGYVVVVIPPWRIQASLVAALAILLANFAVDENETIAPHLSFEHHMQILRSLWEHPTFERFARLHLDQPVQLVGRYGLIGRDEFNPGNALPLIHFRSREQGL